MKKRRAIIAVLSVVVVLIVAFIFSNSLKSREESAKDSELVAGVIGPMLEWIFGGKIENLGFFVRKLAHFTEFCMLGLASAGLVVAIGGGREWWLCGYGLLFCLIIAVCDEFIQGFVDRGSAVGDVLIDFCGAMFGFLIVVIAAHFIELKKKEKLNIKEEKTL